MKHLWHTLKVTEVVEILKSNISVGLSKEEAKKRQLIYGTNSLPKPKRRLLISILVQQFLNPLIYLLIISAGIAMFIGESTDALVILVVVFLNAVIGTIQEGRAEQSIEALQKMSKNQVTVIRGGQESVIEAVDIVPGDIVVLHSGDAVVADARIIVASALSVSESVLTGESLHISKSVEALAENVILADRRNMIYAGTFITSGRGLAIVTATGESNEVGKIAKLASATSQPKTQLEMRIEYLGRYIVTVALMVFGLVIAVGLLRGINLSQIFLVAISQVVSLIPEGLPAAMTVALAVGVQRMAKRGTIVRKLAAIETLGATTVICSDKTGTLTRNEMAVSEIFLPSQRREITVTGIGYEPKGHFLEKGNLLDLNLDLNIQQLFMACTLCNDAQLLSPDLVNKSWRIVGDPTEAALLTMVTKGGVDPLVISKKYPRKAEIPFSAEHKMMATQHEIEKKNTVFIKGAPESLIQYCNTFYDNGLIRKIDEQFLLDLQLASEKMANSALRLLTVGYVENSFIDGSIGFSSFLGKVCFLGLIGEFDPPRSEVAESILDCRTAGIKTVMVTGDHKTTGLAIAKQLGIYKDNDLVIDGNELEQLSEAELLKCINEISVFARVHPTQKLRIVKAFQKKKQVVAVTGDGVNDAPALVRANVGVAMGVTGTDVAKAAAKIIITDDNFSTIVKAISEGRLVYQNIRKLILFLFVTSIDEVIILFLSLILGYPPPLAAVQILWINLVAEGTLTLNLIMEPAEGDEMKRLPIPATQVLMDSALLMRIPLMVLTTVAITFGWFVYRLSVGVAPEIVQSETFTILVVCQWFNVLNCRSSVQSALSWSIFKNPWLVGGLVLSNILHLSVIYWAPLNQFFHTVPIDFLQILLIALVASFVLWVEEIRKIFVRKNKNLLNI